MPSAKHPRMRSFDPRRKTALGEFPCVVLDCVQLGYRCTLPDRAPCRDSLGARISSEPTYKVSWRDVCRPKLRVAVWRLGPRKIGSTPISSTSTTTSE